MWGDTHRRSRRRRREWGRKQRGVWKSTSQPTPPVVVGEGAEIQRPRHVGRGFGPIKARAPRLWTRQGRPRNGAGKNDYTKFLKADCTRALQRKSQENCSFRKRRERGNSKSSKKLAKVGVQSAASLNSEGISPPHHWALACAVVANSLPRAATLAAAPVWMAARGHTSGIVGPEVTTSRRLLVVSPRLYSKSQGVCRRRACDRAFLGNSPPAAPAGAAHSAQPRSKSKRSRLAEKLTQSQVKSRFTLLGGKKAMCRGGGSRAQRLVRGCGPHHPPVSRKSPARDESSFGCVVQTRQFLFVFSLRCVGFSRSSVLKFPFKGSW